MRHYIEGHWYLDIPQRTMVYIRSGEYSVDEPPQPAFGLETHLLPGLFQAAMDAGILPLTPSRDSRNEDLKIIHRLLDLLVLRVGALPA